MRWREIENKMHAVTDKNKNCGRVRVKKVTWNSFLCQNKKTLLAKTKIKWKIKQKLPISNCHVRMWDSFIYFFSFLFFFHFLLFSLFTWPRPWPRPRSTAVLRPQSNPPRLLPDPQSIPPFYNSSSYWDEFVLGGAWLYYATWNSSYLLLATNPKLVKHAGAFWGGPDYGVLSWDNKLAGAQVTLCCLSF